MLTIVSRIKRETETNQPGRLLKPILRMKEQEREMEERSLQVHIRRLERAKKFQTQQEERDQQPPGGF
jgi:hypothetical protein